jgi:hypothetical protein
VAGCERDHQFAMKRRKRACRDNQAAIRGARECSNGALNLITALSPGLQPTDRSQRLFRDQYARARECHRGELRGGFCVASKSHRSWLMVVPPDVPGQRNREIMLRSTA